MAFFRFGILAFLACVGVGWFLVVGSSWGAELDWPQVIIAWPAGPLEVRVAFAKAVPPGLPQRLVGESIRMDDGYQGQPLPVINTKSEPVGSLRIAAARLEDGGKTLVLATDPHSRPATYTFWLPPLQGSRSPAPRISYDLSGVVVSWDEGDENAKPTWTSWWPEFESEPARKLTRGSTGHDQGWALFDRPGRLTLGTLVSPIPGKSTLRIVASRPITEASLAGQNATPALDADGQSFVEFPIESWGEALDLIVVVRTGERKGPFSIKAVYRGVNGQTLTFTSRILSVLWAPPSATSPAPAPAPPDFSGGDARLGESVFFSEAAKCLNCHQVRGKGGKVGPDLSTVGERPAVDIYRDVAEPSALIRPDFVPYTVATKDGRVLAGIVRAEGANAIRVTDTEAKSTVISRSEIEDLRPSATSVMPVGLVGAIGEAKMRDLMAFLMSLKP